MVNLADIEKAQRVSADFSRSSALAPFGERLLLFAIVLLSAGLNLFDVEQNGLGNVYYAVTVKSMMLNWHNWFYASFDPGGFVSVDKPPLGLWIQSVSVWFFGFNGLALLLPEAIAGMLSVWLLYRIVGKHFSHIAALISACVLAISPINVVTNRSNIFESLLVLFLLAATFAATQAMQSGSLCWLVVSGVLLGLAFNIKMLEAYLVVPALGTAYFLTAPIPRRTRIKRLVVAGGVMLAVSFSWIMAVTLTPIAQRPYIGSSYHNSEFDLLWLYNGLQRLNGTPWTQPLLASDPQGVPGIFRLIIPQLAGQSGWFLLLALVMLGLVAFHAWWAAKQRPSQQQGAILLWGLWLIPMLIFFSMAHVFEVYYLALLTPAIAALVGIGLTDCWTAGKLGKWEGLVLAGGVFATSVEEVIILSSVLSWNTWLIPVIGFSLAIFLTIWVHVCTAQVSILLAREPISRILQGIVIISLAGTLALAPLLWTLSSLHPDVDPGFPRSGPIQANTNIVVKPNVPQTLISYLNQHAGSTQFLVATVDVETASPIILATGRSVMALGGYTGFDPILTPITLSQRIANHSVRFFLLPASNLTIAQINNLYPQVEATSPYFTNQLTQWVAQSCQVVAQNEWDAPQSSPVTTLSSLQLFDCGA